MSAPEPLSFVIGGGPAKQTYSISDPLPDWRLNVSTPMCGRCGEVVHFAWDSPPVSGLGFCGCNRESIWAEVQLLA